MTTEVIFVELKLYEANLAKLLTTYELAHKNYLDSMKQKNSDASKTYLSQMNDLNQEILLLLAEISQNIVKINNDDKYAKYKNEIATKMSGLNTLYSKLQEDETTIKGLMFDFIDLDGKNSTFRLQHKANISTIMLYLFLFCLIIYFFFRFSLSSETTSYETVILILAILLLIYMFWTNISGWTDWSVRKAGGATTSYASKLLNI